MLGGGEFFVLGSHAKARRREGAKVREHEGAWLLREEPRGYEGGEGWVLGEKSLGFVRLLGVSEAIQ